MEAPSPASPCSAWPRARSTRPSPASRAACETKEPLARLRRLPAQVEIAVAAGDLKTARAAADELEAIVDSYKIGERRAPPSTRRRISRAVRSSLPRRTGTAARPACSAHATSGRGSARRTRPPRRGCCSASPTGDAATTTPATVELEGALATFERLGARIDEERAKELLGRLQARRTFLFTDIVDSTRLLETLGDEKWKRLLARHDELLRERIVEHGGEVVKKTGDGFFASFENPKAAIDAAVAIQRALADEIVAPDVRIGAHTGEAFRTGADGADYGGQDVHVAARIGAAAGPAEILVERRRSTASDGVPALGAARGAAAGIAQPIEVVSIDWR